MKQYDSQAPESRRGRMGRRALVTGMTIGVLVVVLLLNVGVSALSQRYIFQIDQTVTRYKSDNQAGLSFYTLTDELHQLMAESVIPMVDQVNADRATRGEEAIAVEIIFCDDRDHVNATEDGRHILYTALRLQNAFPGYFNVSFINAEKNPSALQKYKVTSSSHIYTSNVIMTFGTEFRVCSRAAFQLTDSDTGEALAYNGEKSFANFILAITRAEAPVVGFVTNHGEALDRCASFRALTERAGYRVVDIDLEKDEIPADCRILISYDPQTDFHAFGNLGENGVSEIEKLDVFLDQAYSFLLFVDDDTPVLPNLEEYMEEWGITVARGQTAEGENYNYHLNDPVSRLDTEGDSLVGVYETLGPGASLTSDMRSGGYPAKVVFPNATAIKLSESYTVTYATDDASGQSFNYGSYYRNAVSRSLGNIFAASRDAVAYVNGTQYEVATAEHPFRLMTLSAEDRIANETNLLSSNDRSYVCVIASTDFASDEVLDSAAYGNANVLLATLNVLGRELVRANIDFKLYKDYAADTTALDDMNTTAITVVLAVIPAVICFGMGVFVCVRRKYK